MGLLLFLARHYVMAGMSIAFHLITGNNVYDNDGVDAQAGDEQYSSDIAITNATSSYSYLDDRIDCNGRRYRSIKDQYSKYGYAIYRSCSLSDALLNNVSRFVSSEPIRVLDRYQDAYLDNDYVRDVALDPDTLSMLEYLHDRRVFPFQTLNFYRPTEQELHSDIIHFDTLPTRGLLCGSWLALEDIDPLAGPLEYYPRTQHRLWDFDELNMHMDVDHRDGKQELQHEYGLKLRVEMEQLGFKPKYALVKKGETFISAASLVNGGAPVKAPQLSRMTQLTHYFLDGAESYWVPRMSMHSKGYITHKCRIFMCQHNGIDKSNCAAKQLERFRHRHRVTGDQLPKGLRCSDGDS